MPAGGVDILLTNGWPAGLDEKLEDTVKPPLVADLKPWQAFWKAFRTQTASGRGLRAPGGALRGLGATISPLRHGRHLLPAAAFQGESRRIVDTRYVLVLDLDPMSHYGNIWFILQIYLTSHHIIPKEFVYIYIKLHFIMLYCTILYYIVVLYFVIFCYIMLYDYNMYNE